MHRRVPQAAVGARRMQRTNWRVAKPRPLTHADASRTFAAFATASRVFAPRALPAPATAIAGPKIAAASTRPWVRRTQGLGLAGRLVGRALRYLAVAGFGGCVPRQGGVPHSSRASSQLVLSW